MLIAAISLLISVSAAAAAAAVTVTAARVVVAAFTTHRQTIKNVTAHRIDHHRHCVHVLMIDRELHPQLQWLLHLTAGVMP